MGRPATIGAWVSATLSSASTGRKGALTSLSLPASILEKSSTSLTIRRSASAAVSSALSRGACAARPLPRASSSRLPSNAFSGVRISWLIAAKKVERARIIASVACWAERSCSCSACCAVQSCTAQNSTASSR
ncbi:hypothetical protein D9M72_413980 [compost metagenome]